MSLETKVSSSIYKYKLLERGDGVAIAYSGGKDSAVLLDILSKNKNIENLFVIHLDMGFGEDLNGIKTYLQNLRYPFYVEKTDFGKQAEKTEYSPCFLCSFLRRKRIFEIAHNKGFKKIAFGHTRDDAIITFLMNIFYHGEVSTISPKQVFFNGKITIIRPLYYVSKIEIERYIQKRGLSYFENPCPYSGNTKRKNMEKLLDKFPDGRNNVYKALFTIKKEFLP